LHLGVSHAIDQTQYLPRTEMKVTMDLGSVILERIFEGLPVHWYFPQHPKFTLSLFV
jgi:hypothetical protein